MNTIHSSSLAFYPTGYLKPEQDSLNKKQAPLDEPNPLNLNLPAWTPEQIQKAMASAGLNKHNDFSQEANTRTNRAVQAYHQTRDQPIQAQLENIISRVDYYV
ncbi:hypothetical protein [Methylomonas rapida]|uniref:Uncharacterized protein n=1 Tax=Methylomonas rapida TaxID=2963939 RepID=A0ABY7GHI6_9GAMM|nr:hypothetical protein [Methylomonas rapida]WAR43906.1 hypothetical protein NM686_016235 [Methylomonas rapida]